MPELNREEIAKLEALYASNPEGRVFTHLAEAYRKAGEFERARSILEQGLTKHPAYASAHVVLGRVYADLNETDQANASFRHVLELDPHNLVALRSLGEIARSQGQTDEALHYFEELRHQDPSNNDIEGVIAELRQAQMAPPEEPGPTFEEPEAPATFDQNQPEFEGASPGMQDEAAAMETLPGFEDNTPDYGDLVSPDIDLGWSDTPASNDALPGDLADFAAQADTSAPEPVPPEFEPELPSFEAESDIQPPIDAPIDLSDFEHIEDSTEYTSTEDPWSMTMDAAESEEPAPEEATSEESPSETGMTTEATEAEEPAVVTFAHFESITTIETIGESEPEPEPEPQPEPEPESEPETEAAAAPLMTETMAELYTEQGLYEQAAQVYRSLMAERPWDPDLPIRMAEAEAKARGEDAPQPKAEPMRAEVPQPEESDDKVDSPWMGAGVSATSAPTPYAWTEDAGRDAEDEGPPISGYFRSLLSWRPGQAAAPASSPHQSEPEPEPEGANFEPAPAIADVPAIIDLDSPVSQQEPEPAPEPWSASAQPPIPATAAATSDNPVEAAFDEWFNASDFGEEPAPAAHEKESSDPQPEPPAGEAEDDDDLEMFRSWLQSLKK